MTDWALDFLSWTEKQPEEGGKRATADRHSLICVYDPTGTFFFQSQVTGTVRRQLECTRLEIDKTLAGCLFEDRSGRVYRVEETSKGAKLVLQ